ncbi:MAG: LemA family protein, partial [Oligoflexales bacterium]|nr:LemA family protein [Oligoflexales bacterium]
EAESRLAGTLGQFFAVSESYPDLKSDANMLRLQEELTSTENKVAFARQAYNDSVTKYNNARETFPSVFIANMFNFKPAVLFEVEKKEERSAVKVSF